jgi:Class III cytochrome C family
MNRKFIFFLVSIAYLILIVYGLSQVYNVEATLRAKEAQAPLIKPENKISIAHTEIFGKLERPQVIFNHGKHQEAYKKEGCNTCHPQEDGQVSFDFPKDVKKKDKTSVMKAFHDECIGCHTKRSIEKQKTGPVVCGDCHKEKEKTLDIKYPVFEFDFYVHNEHVKKLREKMGKDDCGLCHHTYDINEEDEALALVYEKGTEESCYYCHELGRKRGPELTAIASVAAKKGLSLKTASHLQCLNCHLESAKTAKKDEKVGPVECIKCHTGKYRTIAELEKIPRPDRNQPARPFINMQDAKMKGVTFDHDFHEKTHKNCRICHHETLKACKDCHSLVGKPAGNGVNVARAYHDVFSEHSCEGCHNLKKAEKNCFGCHSNIPVMDVESVGPKRDSCVICHNGEMKGPFSRPPLSAAGLDPKKVLKEVEIKVLGKEYEPAKLPHLEIIKKLSDVSNKSKLGNYFHVNMQTLCKGCHHRSPEAAEAQKDTPPYCRNCHMAGYDSGRLSSIRLLTAYHNQCMGCHDKMGIEKGNSVIFKEGDRCAACHKKKTGGPTEITRIKNENVVKQNTHNILNVW